jgi:hypothetical protein
VLIIGEIDIRRILNSSKNLITKILGKKNKSLNLKNDEVCQQNKTKSFQIQAKQKLRFYSSLKHPPTLFIEL